MAKDGLETFTERFNRLTASMSRKQIGQLLDLTDGAVRKLQEGTTQSLKAHGAIALARHLKVSVEYLAERGPLPYDPRLASAKLFADGLTPPEASDEDARRSRPSLQEQWDAFRADLRPALLKLADVLEQGSPEAQALLRALGETAPPSPGRRKGR